MSSGLSVDDDGVAVDGADGHGRGGRMIGGAGTLRLNGQLPQDLVLPPLGNNLKQIQLMVSGDPKDALVVF